MISYLIEIVKIKGHQTNKTTSYNPFIIDLWIRLLSFHSPLLRKSIFVSVPLPINMFKFGRFSYMKLIIIRIWKLINTNLHFLFYWRSASINIAQSIQPVKKTAMYIDKYIVNKLQWFLRKFLFQLLSKSGLNDVWTALTEDNVGAK